MPKRIKTITVVLTGLLMAIVFLLTFFIKLNGPIPPGYINLGDSAVIVAGIILGPWWGFLAGSVGSAAADIALSASIFAPITFVVKGLEALVASIIYRMLMKKIRSYIDDKASREKAEFVAYVTTSICGVLIMITGYFLAEWFILPLYAENFGNVAALAELPLNAIQGIAGAIAVSYTHLTLPTNREV